MLARLVLLSPLVVCFLLLVIGCAEGPLWKTGYLSPSVRQQWEDEEQIAKTLIGKRKEMHDMVAEANDRGISGQEEVASYLTEVVSSDPVLLLRIEAVRLLSELSVDAAGAGVRLAAKDQEVPVRNAAVRSLARLADEASAQTLANMSRHDENEDIRIAATAALGQTRGPATMAALTEALNHPNPAMQLCAADALEKITGQNFGNDIPAWQRFVESSTSQSETTRTAQESESADDFSFRR